ncbi:MAG: hypothetical protein ACI8TQ_000916 [Planctomycetota bacterium]
MSPGVLFDLYDRVASARAKCLRDHDCDDGTGRNTHAGTRRLWSKFETRFHWLLRSGDRDAFVGYFYTSIRILITWRHVGNFIPSLDGFDPFGWGWACVEAQLNR